MLHTFTDRKPWVATEDDCKAPWGGLRNGANFKCAFCGHKFIPGDKVRWEFTNDTKGAGGNPLICVECDGTREEIIAKMIDLNKGSDVLRAERNALRKEIEKLIKLDETRCDDIQRLHMAINQGMIDFNSLREENERLREEKRFDR